MSKDDYDMRIANAIARLSAVENCSKDNYARSVAYDARILILELTTMPRDVPPAICEPFPESLAGER